MLVLQFPRDARVTVGAVWDDVRVTKWPGCCHADRLEYPLPQEIPIGFDGDAMNQKAEQIIACVAVTPFGAWLKLEGLPQICAREFLLGIFAVEVDNTYGPIGLGSAVRDIGDAGRVCQQASYRHGLQGARRFGEVFRDAVIESELSV